MNWWYTEHLIDGKRQTPTQYLKEHYLSQDDKQIAQFFKQQLEIDVTKNAIKKRRHRLELYRNNQVVTQQTFETENNYATGQASVSNIDELIEQCKVNTAIWEVESFRTWQGFAKVDGELTTIPLSSASFVRKEPLPILPVISAIKATTMYAPNKLEKGEVRTALVIADLHIGYTKDLRNAKLEPFHNRRAIDIVIELAATIQPNRIIILGDLLDLSEWSDKFLRSPEFYFVTQPAIIESFFVLHTLRNLCPNAQISLHQGNHEKRIENAISKYLPFAYGLKPTTKLDCSDALSIPNLLDLDTLNIKYISDYPNDTDVINRNLEIMHGDRALSEFRTVSDVAKKSQVSKIIGHIHRLETASHTHWTGKNHNVVECVCPGCLCHIDGRVPGSKREQWQNGILMVNYTHSDYSYNLVPIKCDCLVYDNWILCGKDYTHHLQKDFPDWNW